MGDPLRVLFMGSGAIGIPALEWLAAAGGRDARGPAGAGGPGGHREPGGMVELVGLVAQPDKPAGRHQVPRPPPTKPQAVASGIPVLQPATIKDPAAVAAIAALRPDVIVVMAYGQILPPALLRVPRRACINLHASLLPRHRGAAPIPAAITAGDRETGITVMHVDEGLDTGDILLHRPLAIRRRETAGSLHDRLAALAPEAMAAALAVIAAGAAPRRPQDPAFATYAPKLRREAAAIDWNQPAAASERRIRAFNPWPVAWTTVPLRGVVREVRLWSAVVCRRQTGPPGMVLRADPRGILVGTGDGALLLKTVQVAGGQPLGAAAFLRGHPVAAGASLGR